ncbi:MAG: hypothetical protein U5Q44_16205 [Dehalococcoidia bacterium]|nr:hypothetical protein [Dehalococcoidia bacterium]
MLARIIESHGIPTVTVTMMPETAEKMHAPRIVGVQVPFGHNYGTPGNDEFQLAVSRGAVRAADEAKEPGYRLDVDLDYPVEDRVAYKTWQPSEPSPVIAEMLKRREQEQQQQSG